MILKKAIYPEIFLQKKLLDALYADTNNTNNYTLEDIKDWIKIEYFTSYTDKKRKLLGFTLTIPEVIDSPISRFNKTLKIIDNFGRLIQPQLDSDNNIQKDEVVEVLYRYEDDSILHKIIEYHVPVFEIEMRLREVLNYILAYNLDKKNTYEFLQNIENMEMANADLRNKPQIRKRRFVDNYENELFHIVMTKYGNLKKPIKRRNTGDYQKAIRGAKDLSTLKEWLDIKEALDIQNFPENHRNFILDIQSRLNPIEKLRNDIMHNRYLDYSLIDDFKVAYEAMDSLMKEFWNTEKSLSLQKVNIEEIKEYLLQVIFAHNLFERLENDIIKFQDLYFQEQEMWVEEFKVFIFEQISEILSTKYAYQFTAESETDFYEEVEVRLSQ